MFCIAICDDEPAVCLEIERLIWKDERLQDYDISINIFRSGEELIAFMESDHKFDIIILDIEFPTMNGVEIGRTIREEKKDELTQILYISSKKSYAMELFDNRPLSFLIKPVDKDKLIVLILKAIELSNIADAQFEFKEDGLLKFLPCKEIRYFASENKKIHMETTTGRKIFYGKMGDIQEKLTKNNFIRIHQSILINYEYIAKALYTEIYLTTGEILPVSQRYRVVVRESLNESRRKRR